MLSETLTLYNKYQYNLFIYSNERLFLFIKNREELDHENFEKYYFDVLSFHNAIKRHWKYYKSRRSQIIKKFEYEKIEILIRPYFCSDIKFLILSYIF